MKMPGIFPRLIVNYLLTFVEKKKKNMSSAYIFVGQLSVGSFTVFEEFVNE